MGVDLTIYVEYQTPDGSWAAVCTTLEFPNMDRHSAFFALIAPAYESPLGINTTWTRDYPVIEMKTFMPESMDPSLEYLRQLHGRDRPWVNWVTGKELLEWYQRVDKVENEELTRELDDSDFEDAQTWVGDNASSMAFTPMRRPEDRKLSSFYNFTAMKEYLTRTQKYTGIQDPARVRLFFVLQ